MTLDQRLQWRVQAWLRARSMTRVALQLLPGHFFCEHQGREGEGPDEQERRRKYRRCRLHGRAPSNVYGPADHANGKSVRL